MMDDDVSALRESLLELRRQVVIERTMARSALRAVDRVLRGLDLRLRALEGDRVKP